MVDRLVWLYIVTMYHYGKGRIMKSTAGLCGLGGVRRVGLALGACLLGVAWAPAALAATDAAAFGRLQAEMRARQFDQATATADALVAAKDTRCAMPPDSWWG